MTSLTPLGPLGLVVIAALSWAGFDLVRKLLAKAMPPLGLLALLTSATAIPFLIWALWDGVSIRSGYWLPALGSVALNIVANLLFLEALRTAELSRTVPLLSLTPAFASLVGVPLLGEVPSGLQIGGIALVVLGAFSLNASGAAPRTDLAVDHRGWVAPRGFWLMAGTALFWSLSIPLDKLALTASSPQWHAFVQNAGVAIAILIELARRGKLSELGAIRYAPWTFLGALALSGLAIGSQLFALVHVPVSQVETIKRGLGNVAAVAAGHWVFQEPITIRKVVAVIAMALGVALILR